MAWILVALFIFDGSTTVMSDNILYQSIEQCNEAADIRSKFLDATRPPDMSEADYFVWCTQIPQEV